MASEQLESVLGHIRKLVTAQAEEPASDHDLLERFVRDRDEAAFAALVRRHGPMVLGVCRRILRHAHDAEDACQAAFLVLARKAAVIRKKESVASFLHGVAFRVACRLHRDVARRQARETAVEDVPGPEPAEVTWREVRQVLDEELRRLPRRFQAPLLLCYLEGRTRDEAAQELGWTPGTLRGRLERGRELLRARLARRGVTLSAAILGALLGRNATAALPATLFVRVLRTALAAGPAAGALPTTVLSLTEGVMKAMLLARLKLAAVVGVMIGLAGVGAVVLTGGALPAQQAAAEEPSPSAVVLADAGEAADPAPSGADPEKLARNQALSRLNLKKLALAMHNYLDTYGHFPAPAMYAAERAGVGGAVGPGGGMMGRPAGMMPPGGMAGVGPPGGIPAGGPGPMVPGGAGRGPGMGQPDGTPGGGMGGPMPGGAPPGMRPGGPPGGAGIMGMPGMPGGGLPPGGGGVRGKALLSWRVALLPFLGEGKELYAQFALDEPWDSPHNLKLLNKMPAVFAAPGSGKADAGKTWYQVFVGPHAAFEKHRNLRLPDFTDGTSNTILIAEAGCPVPWTKPEDLPYAADEPLPGLGGLFPDVVNVALADGSVTTLAKNGDRNMLRKAIERADGSVINWSAIRAPASSREADLRRHNDHLRASLEEMRAQVEILRREKEVLQEEDAETLRLKKENENLERLLQQTRDETERLRKEVERLKQDRRKPKDE